MNIYARFIFSISAACMCAILLLPVGAHAQAGNPAGKDTLNFLDETARYGGLTSQDKIGSDTEDRVLKVIGNIINVVLAFVGIVFFAQMFWAGARWSTSGGNDEVINESKSSIRAALIGIVITLSSFLITNFVLNQVGRVTGQQAVIPGAPGATAGTTSGTGPLGACTLTTPADGFTECNMADQDTCENVLKRTWLKDQSC